MANKKISNGNWKIVTGCTSQDTFPSLLSFLRSMRLVGIREEIIVLTNNERIKNLIIQFLTEKKLLKANGGGGGVVDDDNNNIVIKVAPIYLMTFGVKGMKVHLWNMIDSELLFWIDLDIVVMHNFVKYFRENHYKMNSTLYAVPDNIGCKEGEVRKTMCTGFFITKPNIQIYEELVVKIQTWNIRPLKDQPMFIHYFRNKVTLLPEIYSSFPWNCECNRFKPEDLMIAHFTHFGMDNIDKKCDCCQDVYRERKYQLSN